MSFGWIIDLAFLKLFILRAIFIRSKIVFITVITLFDVFHGLIIFVAFSENFIKFADLFSVVIFKAFEASSGKRPGNLLFSLPSVKVINGYKTLFSAC